jgi:hypothetical protein
MGVVMKRRYDFMRYISTVMMTGTYSIHPNSHAATVNLNPKMRVHLAILVSCRKLNVVLIIPVCVLVNETSQ